MNIMCTKKKKKVKSLQDIWSFLSAKIHAYSVLFKSIKFWALLVVLFSR